MATIAPPVTRHRLDEATSRRPLHSRVSSAHLLAALAALLAVVLNLLVLRGDEAQTLVAVVADDVAAGTPLAASHLRFVAAPAGDALSGLIAEDEAAGLLGSVTAVDLAAGSVLTPAVLVPAAAADGLATMSLPIDRAHAAGGRLHAGDQVDVIAVVDGAARYVVTGALVVGVVDDEGAIGTLGDFAVTIAVDGAAALDIAEALAADAVHVIRSTGVAPTVAVSEPPRRRQREP